MCCAEHLIQRTSKERFLGTVALGKFRELGCYLCIPLAYFSGLLLLWEFPGSATLRRKSLNKALSGYQ